MTEKRSKLSKKTRNQLAVIAIILLIVAAILVLPYVELPSNESQATIAVTLIGEDGSEVPYDASQRLTLLNAKVLEIFVGDVKITGVKFTLKVRMVYTGTPPSTPEISWTPPFFSLYPALNWEARITWGGGPAVPFVKKDLTNGIWVDITNFNLDASVLEEKIPEGLETWNLLLEISKVEVKVAGQTYSGSPNAGLVGITKHSFAISKVEIGVGTIPLT